MTAHVTFSGLTVSTRRVTRRLQESTYVFEIDFDCITTSLSEITALAALVGPITKTRLLSGKISVQNPLGTVATLVVNGTSYSNCSIESLIVSEYTGSHFGAWPYTIGFVQDTSV
jgi:hypothetical protein